MNLFELCRDDGPLARVLGATLGAVVRLPAIALLAVAALPLLVVPAIEGSSASDAAVGVVLGWFVLVAGASSGRPHTDPLRWAVPPLLRLGEYAGILWLGALAGGRTAAAFALLAALAFRHYDLFYRPRFLGAAPPRWLGDLAGGWEGRLIVAYVLLLAGALPAGLFAIAGVLGVLFVAESVHAWSRYGRVSEG